MNKKYFRTTVSAFALILAFAGTNTTNAWAEDIEYNGTQADYDKFHSEKDGTYVTSHQSAVKNTVTVDNQGNLADDVYKAPDTVAGASVSNGTTSENTVTIQEKIPLLSREKRKLPGMFMEQSSRTVLLRKIRLL